MSGSGFAKVKLMGNLASCADGGKLPDLSFLVPIKLSNIMNQLEDAYHFEMRRDSILILVNGVEANALDDLETLVQAGDEVVFIPMFHGGLL
ncbi:MAG: MoaD/ThiS family protein [Nitrososphaerales archaeon]